MTTYNYSVGDLTDIPYSNSTYLDDFYTDDVYTFNIDGTSSINLNLHNITAGDDADLYLYQDTNENGVFDTGIDQQVQSSTSGSNSDDSINYLGEAGTYFAQVHRYSSGSLDYELDISATTDAPLDTQTQPPNLLPTEVDGGTLFHGDALTYYGWVGDTDTADVYQFTLDSYSNVDITLTGLSNDADIRLIQDSNNNDIVDAGESQSLFASNSGGITDENISFSLHGGNTFYVQVYQYSGDTSYELQVAASSWI